MEFFTADYWDLAKLTELVGFVSGLLCVWLAARQNVWTFPLALISAGFYVVVFKDALLFADMGLQVMFAVLNFYGWYLWLYKSGERTERPVTHTLRWQWIVLLVLTPLFTFGLGRYLDLTTPADIPYWDAGTTAVSLGAQWLMSRKKLENWLIWLAVDIVYVPIYLHKELYLTAVLYALFIPLAWIGYRDWKKDLQLHQARPEAG
ncbi:nicotinamide riboside transporter PnuC [Nibribacter ruber]|uniref:Nicotinamide riboside transporter PnuC n=1 Tax=Nibribacter ruber TaxID=2698458 RepID=A0A6P1P362_9BACT|nr:nicotinamide riboside transporter PnuC [Nibribacter ruber]QHL88805.1 nicotinamide riboside transporter PnuC [Nibribacter ruber]